MRHAEAAFLPRPRYFVASAPSDASHAVIAADLINKWRMGLGHAWCMLVLDMTVANDSDVNTRSPRESTTRMAADAAATGARSSPALNIAVPFTASNYYSVSTAY